MFIEIKEVFVCVTFQKKKEGGLPCVFSSQTIRCLLNVFKKKKYHIPPVTNVETVLF